MAPIEVNAVEESCYLCPTCGTSSVDYGELVGSQASCRICKWSGSKEDLINAPFAHTQGGSVGISLELFNDLRRVISVTAFMLPFSHFLERWGFIDRSASKAELVRSLSRYTSAVARSMIKAVIEEREAIEKEAHRGG